MWYDFPVGLRKHLQLIIADSQRRKVYHGFGLIELHLNAFTKVIGFSIIIRALIKCTKTALAFHLGYENRHQLLLDVQKRDQIN